MDEEVRQKALDTFGAVLMRVRDQAIRQVDSLVEGRTQAPLSREFAIKFGSFNTEQMDVVHQLILEVVDTTLHHLLWVLGEIGDLEKNVLIMVQTPEGTVNNLAEISDGLEGELYDWVPDFSKERYDPARYAHDGS